MQAVLNVQWDDAMELCEELEREPSTQKLNETKEALMQIRLSMGSMSGKDKIPFLKKLKEIETRVSTVERQLLLDKRPEKVSTTPEDDGLNRLQTALQQLHECEANANETMENLRAQRDSLERTHSKLLQSRKELDHSSNLLKKMNQFWRG